MSILERYPSAMMNAFGTPKLAPVKGTGCVVEDENGKQYLDFLAGIAVNSLGHAHPKLVAAITEQLQTLGHVSNFFATEPQVRLAEKLGELLGEPAKVFFTNSGAESNEAAFKITRLSGRTKIIALEGSFHGRTMGTLALTHTLKYREPFEPLPGEIVFIPPEIDALEAAVDEQTAAVVLEVIQGENGVLEIDPEFIRRAHELTTSLGALLWIDEVQTGMGRCGAWFAHQSLGVQPDLVTVAKGLGGGFPVGACLAVGKAAELFTPGLHGSTFGGNPVAAAAGLAVIDTIESDDLLNGVVELGDYLSQRVLGLGNPLVASVSGRGLLRGIQLTEDVSTAATDALLQRGFIVNAPRPSTIRVAPPLIVSTEQLDSFVSALDEVLTEIGATRE